jgi:hypothetical protein
MAFNLSLGIGITNLSNSIFSPFSLSPYQWTMMETGLLNADGDAASSGDSISVVQNLGSGASNYGQTRGADQPVLHKTKGLYCPGVAGNYGRTAISTTPTYPFTLEVDAAGTNNAISLCDEDNANRFFAIRIDDANTITVERRNTTYYEASVTTTEPIQVVKVIFQSETTYDVYNNGVLESAVTGQPSVSLSSDFDTLLFGNVRIATPVAGFDGNIRSGSYSSGATTVVSADFTTQDHNTTSFTPTVGGTVTISQAGNDPATVIEYPFLRFDGSNSFLEGTFDSALSGGYLFCLFSVIGNGGVSFGRVFSVIPTGGSDTTGNGAIWLGQLNDFGDSRSYFEGGTKMQRVDGYEGTGLHEVRLKTGAHKSLLNGAAELTDTTSTTFNLQEFLLGAGGNSNGNPAAIDVFVHGLFDKDLSEAEAVKVRSYIGNQRTNISTGYV